MAGTDNPRTRQAKLIGGRDRKAVHGSRWDRPPDRLVVGLSSRLCAIGTLRIPLLILVLTVLAAPSGSNAQLPPLPGTDAAAAERKPQLFVPEIRCRLVRRKPIAPQLLLWFNAHGYNRDFVENWIL